MGRTVVPITQAIHEEVAGWAKFRRALRKEDQAALDECFQAALMHAAEGAYASRTDPFEVVVLAILVEQQKAIRALAGEVARLGAEGSGLR
jgi:selenophosphate synthetase-related protein